MPGPEIPVDRLAKYEVKKVEDPNTPSTPPNPPTAPDPNTPPADAVLDDAGKTRIKQLLGVDESQRSDDEKVFLEKHKDFVTDYTNKQNASKVEAKIAELSQKNEEELTDEDRQFLEEHADAVNAYVTKDNSVIQLMQAEGYINEGEFDNSFDGLQAYLEKRDKVAFEKKLESYFEENPMLKKVKEHVDKKLPLESLIMREQKPAILSQELPKITGESSEEQKTAIAQGYETLIRQAYQSKGVDSLAVNAIIKSASESGKLYEQAVTAQKMLSADFDAKIASYEETEQAEAQKIIDDAKLERAQAIDIVTKNAFTGGLKIPTADIDGFKNYVGKVISTDGMTTMADQKYSKLSLAQKLWLDYIVYKDFKLPNVVTSATKALFASKKGNDNRLGVLGAPSGNQSNPGRGSFQIDFEGVAKKRGLGF